MRMICTKSDLWLVNNAGHPTCIKSRPYREGLQLLARTDLQRPQHLNCISRENKRSSHDFISVLLLFQLPRSALSKQFVAIFAVRA